MVVEYLNPVKNFILDKQFLNLSMSTAVLFFTLGHLTSTIKAKNQ